MRYVFKTTASGASTHVHKCTHQRELQRASGAQGQRITRRRRGLRRLRRYLHNARAHERVTAVAAAAVNTAVAADAVACSLREPQRVADVASTKRRCSGSRKHTRELRSRATFCVQPSIGSQVHAERDIHGKHAN